MKPGRELDALIAEKVMGLEPWPEQQEAKPCSCPSYSTDIAAAWQIVKKFEREASICSCPYGGWQASFIWLDSNPYSNECLEWSYGETAPHAICLAALKAIETK